MTHFYLTLPSNSSSKYYDNTLTKFTTKLLSSVSLSGNWEVGLAEITFPRTWYTVDKRGAHFSIEKIKPPRGSNNILTAVETEELTDYKISWGYYESIQGLVKEMNAAMERLITVPTVGKKEEKFKFNPVNRKVVIQMKEYESLTLSPTLSSILGVTGTGVDNLNPTSMLYKGDKVCDINRGRTALYVYCDILEYTFVGDTKVPLLRIVPAEGQNGETIHRVFEEPRYIPLQKKNFDSIEIDIRDDLGNQIPFESGKLVATLHFRQAQSPYFLG